MAAHTHETYTEQALARQLRRGDPSAMRRFYDLYAGYLAGVCSRYVADGDDAKDVLQESMVKIMYSIDRFDYRGEGSLRSWATRVTVNEALNLLRERQKVGFAPLGEGAADAPDEPEPDVDDIPAEAIHEMVRRLPDGYRTVFNLFAIEGKSHKEIAGLLGISEATSASQFHRAKNRLAHEINEYRKKLK